MRVHWCVLLYINTNESTLVGTIIINNNESTLVWTNITENSFAPQNEPQTAKLNLSGILKHFYQKLTKKTSL